MINCGIPNVGYVSFFREEAWMATSQGSGEDELVVIVCAAIRRAVGGGGGTLAPHVASSCACAADKV